MPRRGLNFFAFFSFLRFLLFFSPTYVWASIKPRALNISKHPRTSPEHEEKTIQKYKYHPRISLSKNRGQKNPNDTCKGWMG